ncbi:MAG: LPS export ABC transporter permease LptF [Xanthobacteraceae bacterium]
MGSIGRYIFRTTFGAFLLVLISVTLLMWITQALREVDLMTSMGQGVLVFLGITSLVIPMLVMLIAPFALMIAVAHILGKLGNDSELIVMNASGIPPWHIFRPFLAVGVIVSLCVALLSFYLAPKCLQQLRSWANAVRAEIVSSHVQPGRFVAVEKGLTLHVRERLSNGQLSGIVIDDQRDPKERATILAERGDIVTTANGVFLLLANGAVHRHEADKQDPAIVKFREYAFDLSRVSAEAGNVTYSVTERSMAELINPPPKDPLFERYPGRFKAELHNRIAAPLYPLAFLIVTFAYLGAPRTTRQSRVLSLVSAIGLAFAIRIVGFAGMVAGAHTEALLFAPYVVMIATIAIGGWAISRGVIIEPPAVITNFVNAMVEGLQRRTAAATGAAR